ncbi:DMT family transporter [Nocardiopsis ansamitocini]|uniref:Magnesium transporter NIPA n=1 Tax=Nocardiopsis ansamitocini TaxID=1670832 RepID=A0A9W6P568_9ACTN|nr:DMT family transporter [Nocardiopsis ansamitocini]GLU47575.1 hypothetical protein Nans01_19260 [Nocardiopsis ansamitocini]
MTWAVVVAVVGALAIASGAALQERSVLKAPAVGVSQLRLLRHLMRSPRWLLGTLLTVCGVTAHIWALCHAPLTVIQPIGISGLLFAVVLSAFLHKRRLTAAQVAGCLAVTGGLVALLTVLPAHAGEPDLNGKVLAAMPFASVAVMLACLVVARHTGRTTRAWTLALAGGVGFAVTSALARVIGVGVLDDPGTVLRPLTLVTVVLGLSGALMVQNAYRTGHFALAYAVLLISDPLAAAAIGVALLGESLPSGPIGSAVAVLSALVMACGAIVLARSSGSAGKAGSTARPPLEGEHLHLPSVAQAGPGIEHWNVPRNR